MVVEQNHTIPVEQTNVTPLSNSKPGHFLVLLAAVKLNARLVRKLNSTIIVLFNNSL